MHTGEKYPTLTSSNRGWYSALASHLKIRYLADPWFNLKVCMQSVKSITLRKSRRYTAFTSLLVLLLLLLPCFRADNSPYSRLYGLGDLVPSTHVNSRGMAGFRCFRRLFSGLQPGFLRLFSDQAVRPNQKLTTEERYWMWESKKKKKTGT